MYDKDEEQRSGKSLLSYTAEKAMLVDWIICAYSDLSGMTSVAHFILWFLPSLLTPQGILLSSVL